MQNDASIKRNLGERIKQLAAKGLSYRQIEKKLGCSKSTISYHLGKGQKAKCKNRVKVYRAENARATYDHRAEYNASTGTYIKTIQKHLHR
tara:strand:- start:237 stop:509 length:273 start_codon:yes stop_codon:yes gene_type:complete